MKKFLTTILVIQLIAVLTGCCCQCAKKAQEQGNEPAQQETPAQEQSAE